MLNIGFPVCMGLLLTACVGDVTAPWRYAPSSAPMPQHPAAASPGRSLSTASCRQPHLYDAQIPPVVYLSGVAMFVAGLAVVRTHNLWTRNWTVLVTLSGWFFLALGLLRMFTAGQYQRSAAETSPGVFMVLEGCLLVVALVITYKAYARCKP